LTGSENPLGLPPRKKRGFEKSKWFLDNFRDFKLSFVPTLKQTPQYWVFALMVGARLGFFVAWKFERTIDL